jgi:hypothetical protein
MELSTLTKYEVSLLQFLPTFPQLPLSKYARGYANQKDRFSERLNPASSVKQRGH